MFHDGLQQLICAGYFSVWFDGFLCVSHLKCCRIAASFPGWSFRPVFVCASFTHFFWIYHSRPFLLARKTPPLCSGAVRVNMWVRGFHYASSVFRAYMLVGWHFWSLLCKMWRQRQAFAASTSAHRVWPALQCTPSPISLLLFPVSDVRFYTAIQTQCSLWVLEGFCFFLTDSPCNSRICQIQISGNLVDNACHTQTDLSCKTVV